MATGTQASNARQYHNQQVHYLRKRILGAGGNATYTLGTVPAGANILRASTCVRVVMSGGTPTIAWGTSGSGAAFFAANGTPATTLGRNNMALIASAAVGIDVDTVLTATIAGTPTAGTIDVEIEFTVNNDL